MRHVLRLKHMSISTEKASVQWAKRFMLSHHKRRPADMGAPEIRTFLTHLAVQGLVAASTQGEVMYGAEHDLGGCRAARRADYCECR
jgi:hypothetical protein